MRFVNNLLETPLLFCAVCFHVTILLFYYLNDDHVNGTDIEEESIRTPDSKQIKETKKDKMKNTPNCSKYIKRIYKDGNFDFGNLHAAIKDFKSVDKLKGLTERSEWSDFQYYNPTDEYERYNRYPHYAEPVYCKKKELLDSERKVLLLFKKVAQ